MSISKKIIIPSSVTSFGKNCFAGATELSSIQYGTEMEDYYEIIERGRLRNLLTLMKEYEVSEAVTEIANNAFVSSPNLKKVVLHSGIKLNNNSFSNCQVRTLVLAPGIVYVNSIRLKEWGIDEIVLPNGDEIRFDKGAFYSCFLQKKGYMYDYNAAAIEIINLYVKSSDNYLGEIPKKHMDHAADIIIRHREKIGKHYELLLDILIKQCIRRGYSQMLSDLLNGINSDNIDFEMYYQTAKANINTRIDIIELLANKCGEKK